MLPANGIYMAPAKQAAPRGVTRVHLPGSPGFPLAMANGVTPPPAASQKPPAANQETEVQLDFAKLLPATLEALVADPAVPPALSKLAKDSLKERDPVEEEAAADEQAIAASHRQGGFSAFVDRQNAKQR